MRELQPPLTPLESLRSYSSLFLRSAKAGFAYQASTFTEILTAAFIYAVPMLVWRQVYAQDPTGMPLSKEHMFPYLLLACCVNYSLSMGVEFRLGNRIRSGLIATDLLKPVDFQVSQGVICISDSVFHALLGLSVFFCGFLFLGPAVFPASAPAFLMFLASFALAFLIQYGICFIFVQGAFYTYSGYGIFAARGALHQTFSGLSAPLAFYPPLLKTTGDWLPFQHAIHTPVSIYMGWAEGAQALHLLGQQAVWALGLYLLGKLLLVGSLKQLEVQGG